ncbi:MAG: murein biosynthesis integral membrane protein MurJ [Legionellales bacterium]|nr:MAG: murein biosynthesis integral membrane protein MurJ [Legionellales bacterium]
MTLISRILGFVRDVVLAQYFGAGSAYDAFIIAFKIPNFLRRLFAEGAFSQAFVPVISEYKLQHSQQTTKLFLDRVAGGLLLILFIVVVLGMLGTPYIVQIFAPGFSNNAAQLQLASNLLQITFPYVLLIAMVALSGGILNSYDKFALPALTPVLLNISFIVAAIFVAPLLQIPITALAWGLLVAGVLQFLLQVPLLYHLKLLPSPKICWSDPGVRKILRLMVPALLGVAVVQINLIIDSVFASFLEAGSISWLYFSERLMELPLGVFGVALATVILPKLSRSHILRDTGEFQATTQWALQWVLLIAMPAAVGLYMLAVPLLELLFMRGAFDLHDVLMTARSLQAYAGGVVAFMLIKVLASVFYARQDIRTPVRIAIVAVMVNIGGNALLVGPLQHAGLAWATTISAGVNAGLLCLLLLRRNIYKLQLALLLTLLRVSIASVVMILVLLYSGVPIILLIILGGLSYLMTILASYYIPQLFFSKNVNNYQR